MTNIKPEYLALGLAAVAVFFISKTGQGSKTSTKAGAAAQTGTMYGKAGNGPGVFSNLWDGDWTNDYATQASYTPQSMAADPFGLDNNPSNDTAPAMSFAPWYKSERAPWQ